MEILTRCKPDSVENFSTDEIPIPSAVRNGKMIHITPGSFLSVYSSILHEWGHVIGDEYSKEDVLTPYECSNRFAYCFDDSDLSYIDILVSHSFEKLDASERIISMAKKTLTYYLKGKEPPEVKIYNIQPEFLKERVMLSKDSDYLFQGKVRNNKYARNIELSAVTVAYGCLMLTETMLADYCVRKGYTDRFERNLISLSVPEQDAYRRAQNIVAWARREPNRKIPTTKDLGIN